MSDFVINFPNLHSRMSYFLDAWPPPGNGCATESWFDPGAANRRLGCLGDQAETVSRRQEIISSAVWQRTLSHYLLAKLIDFLARLVCVLLQSIAKNRQS
jgi:hypothetical protein